MTALRNPQRRNGGFVLVAVLSVLALLSTLVLTMLLLSRANIDGVALAGGALEADAMVQSALALTGYQLFVLGLPAERVDGRQIRLNQGIVTVSVASEGGKVDLNGAGKELLAAAYRASGLTSLSPESFAARVIDWRDADDETSEGGAEADDYIAAQMVNGPRNSPFRSVDDLRWVLGLSATDVAALRDGVTIYNPRGRLDVFSATPPLIAALPGVAPETVAKVLDLRAVRNEATTAQLADLLLVQSAFIDAQRPASYRVAIEARPNRTQTSIRTDVVMGPGVTPGSAYRILHWTP